MAALLLAGSAAYAALKWKTILPALTENAGNVLNVAKWAAEPITVAVATGVFAGYAIATEDELTERTFAEEIAYANLAAALGTLLWPLEEHWAIGTTMLGAILTSSLIVRDGSNWWAAATAGCIVAYLAIAKQYATKNHQ